MTEARMLNTNSTLSQEDPGLQRFGMKGCTALGGGGGGWSVQNATNFPNILSHLFLAICSPGFFSYPTDFWNTHDIAVNLVSLGRNHGQKLLITPSC